MTRGDRVCGVECSVVRSVVEDVFGSRCGAQYWLRCDDDPEVVFVASTRKRLFGSRVRVSGSVNFITRYENGRVVVWLERPRLFEPDAQERTVCGVVIKEQRAKGESKGQRRNKK